MQSHRTFLRLNTYSADTANTVILYDAFDTMIIYT